VNHIVATSLGLLALGLLVVWIGHVTHDKGGRFLWLMGFGVIAGQVSTLLTGRGPEILRTLSSSIAILLVLSGIVMGFVDLRRKSRARAEGGLPV
jgi:hypothetical protein